jgi:hypothetical protein
MASAVFRKRQPATFCRAINLPVTKNYTFQPGEQEKPSMQSLANQL